MQKAKKAMNIGKLCNRIVVFAHARTPLKGRAKLMREHHVGSLVVVDETKKTAYLLAS
ncbi:MAG: hypothetical protein ABWY12_15190 [Burkholderiales bacterium]